MTVKNQKVCKASQLGRKIEFWSKIEKISRKINNHAKKKIDTYTTNQNTLLNEVRLEINKPISTV